MIEKYENYYLVRHILFLFFIFVYCTTHIFLHDIFGGRCPCSLLLHLSKQSTSFLFGACDIPKLFQVLQKSLRGLEQLLLWHARIRSW